MSVNACTRNTHIYIYTHTFTYTKHNSYTCICTCVGWFPVPLLTLLLHTTWPFYWTLTLIYYTQRSTTRCLYLQFIIPMSYVSVTVMHVVPSPSPMSLGPVSDVHTHTRTYVHVHDSISWLSFLI